MRKVQFTRRSEKSLDKLIKRAPEIANESEIIRELIRERQIREQETPAEIQRIRAALAEGEDSGVSMRAPDEIMNAVIQRKRKNGEL